MLPESCAAVRLRCPGVRNLLLFIIFILLVPVCIFAAESDVMITEVMFNPDGDENAREYVELYNPSGEAVSLEGFRIGDGVAFDDLVPVIDGVWVVPARSYALVLDPDYFDDEPYDAIPSFTPLFTVSDKAIGSRGLSNSTAEPVTLIGPAGDTLSVVVYDLDCPPGHSWERIRIDSADFAPSVTQDGTPGLQNSVAPPSYNPALDVDSIAFGPGEPIAGESLSCDITWINGGVETIGDVTVRLVMEPESIIGETHFTENVSSGERSSPETLVVNNLPAGRLSFVAFIVSGIAGSATVDDTIHVDCAVGVESGDIVITEVMAAPRDGFPEWVELFNAARYPVDLYGWTIVDSAGNESAPMQTHLLVAPGDYEICTESPDIGYLTDLPVITLSSFPALNNDGDSVSIRDSNGVIIDSMSYRDAPGERSLEPFETSDSPGFTWDVSVAPEGATPGAPSSLAYDPHPSDGDVSVSFSPNPFLDDVTVTYRLPFPLARVSMVVYDRRGREIAVLRDSEESGSEWSGVWDGTNGGSRIPVGPYIVDIEVIDKRTGHVYRERKTIVKAARL